MVAPLKVTAAVALQLKPGYSCKSLHDGCCLLLTAQKTKNIGCDKKHWMFVTATVFNLVQGFTIAF